jgi:phosphodiesterase/alkaline phosphatase D-like protein
MTEQLGRRRFLKGTAATTLAVAAVNRQTSQAAQAAAGPNDFVSRWDRSPDRVWLGPEFWANPLQDWRIKGGRIECIKAAPNRNVHVLTRQLGAEPGTLAMSVMIGRVDGTPLAGGPGGGQGTAGFRIGIMGPLKEYRNSLIFGQGLDAGFTSDGKLFIGPPGAGVNVDLKGQASVELRLTVEPHGEQSTVMLAAHAADGKALAGVSRDVPSASLAGNIALVANFIGGAGGGNNAAKGGKKGKGAEKAKSAKNAAKKGAAADVPAGEFWFANWKISGSRVESHDDRAYGPILFNHYTLSRGTLTMTAQMPPLGESDSQTVRLEVQRDGRWQPLGEDKIDPAARTATFRADKWDATEYRVYRLLYSLKTTDGQASEHEWIGTIRRDPVDQPVLTVADVSCNIHEAFPNTLYTANMERLNPDFLAFVGDQFYESTGGYGVQRTPLEPAILDYLRKWYMHGWTWRELTRDRPSISIPDDHDVYQGNLWGESGAPQTTTQEHGGYNMPAEWVNVVHKTQTSHHPAPWDATPCKQGISVYSGPLVYGRISFAILADRQFKSGPEGNVPPTGGRGDHVTDPNFDPKTADVPGLQLLGPGQMEHLRGWITDWQGAEMKAILSQTIFTGMATTHGSPNGRLVADYDTNGWPQTERNAALRAIRKAFAFHIAGDQHLPAVVHYGIDEHNDAGVAFTGPPVNTGYPRWFEPLKPGENRAPGAPENTGQFLDSFGNPMTVLAVANGAKQPRQPVLEKLHDKVSGIGLVRLDKANRRITVECWPLLADPQEPGTQFPGWPVTVEMAKNYGRQPTAFLPKLEIRGTGEPVVTIVEEPSGEIVYTLRLRDANWQPGVFAAGKYTVRISVPETGAMKEIKGVVAQPQNNERLEVTV